MGRTNEVLLIYIFLGLLVIVAGAVEIFGQHAPYKQTDMDDLVTRQLLDEDIYLQIRTLNLQIQADTTVLSAGQTADTIILDRKYRDKAYIVVLTYRSELGTVNNQSPYAYPLTDSTFIINDKNSDDSSTVNWITIYK